MKIIKILEMNNKRSVRIEYSNYSIAVKFYSTCFKITLRIVNIMLLVSDISLSLIPNTVWHGPREFKLWHNISKYTQLFFTFGCTILPNLYGCLKYLPESNLLHWEIRLPVCVEDLPGRFSHLEWVHESHVEQPIILHSQSSSE